jgi:CHASE2 domain-containing sensor protein
LKWYQDQSGETLPQATVTSISILWYRAVMLAWSSWLALALTRWLKWGYASFTTEGYWRPLKPILATPGMAVAPESAASKE